MTDVKDVALTRQDSISRKQYAAGEWDNETQVTACLNRSPVGKCLKRWLSCGKGKFLAIRMNWVSSLMAVAILWGFAIAVIVDPATTNADFGAGKSWVSANFTWLYVGTQDIWCIFLIYLCCSRFGSVKLGNKDEKPQFDDFSWFCMLFTCGVAVGLFVFGVAEPLYYYRQPSIWHTWNYDYTLDKTGGVNNDAQRAQHALFFTAYHWGIHGWVPYILLALLNGVVSYKWNMPMTIRSVFYPLIGDHAMGLLGDLIDGLSISTTTFGVCTSLGLGVQQLSQGLQFIKNIGCSPKTNCEEAGGTWDITGYGADNCMNPEDPIATCTLEWLAGDADAYKESLMLIIGLVTIIATLSVLSGLQNGIKVLSKIAFTLGLIAMLTVVLADNTWYILNTVVQTTGYYIQYIIQVGFDCEAFQQLNFEFDYGGFTNYYWGSDKEDSVASRLAAVGLAADTTSPDCGAQFNPCDQGILFTSLAMALYSGGPKGDAASALLKSLRMSDHSIEVATTNMGKFMSFGYDMSDGGLPCSTPIYGGSPAANTTHFDPWMAEMLGTTAGSPVCAMASAAASSGNELTAAGQVLEECEAFWAAPEWPGCPQMPFADTGKWGMCSKWWMSCPLSKTYYGAHSNPMFMDWWTIFYWAWWITWAPFVGFFVAVISRGRTVREVVVGGFIAPTLWSLLWFCVFGGLAIKLQRIAEIALQVKPDWEFQQNTCREHYLTDGTPITPESKALADAGYYMIDCVWNKNNQLYYLMHQYGSHGLGEASMGLTGFLHVTLWFALVIYFLTSSDSGSMVDDMISASGMWPGYIPVWQKVFWCFTEGIVAIALVSGDDGDGSTSLKSMQAASIVLGLPYTFLLCFMVTSLYRALKYEMGDEDILKSMRFNTQIFDFLELFKPFKPSPCDPMTHLKSIGIGLFAPGFIVYKSFEKCFPELKGQNMFYAGTTQVLLICWFGLIVCGAEGAWVVAWVCMLFMFLCVAFARGEVRRKYNIWGSPLDDLFATMSVYPIVCGQMYMQVTTDGKDAPTYCACFDEIKAEMLAALDGSADAPSLVKAVEKKTSAA
jgi:choline-glycine betaine transporter